MTRLSSLPVSIIALFTCLISPGSARALGVWHRDYAAALSEAKADGKAMLIVFTGTDWIEICGKFYAEILSQPDFINAVSDKFALLKLEYPKDGNLPRAEAMQKAMLRDAYRIRGFPMAVLTDAEGRPFGLNGYQPITAKEYAEQVLEILATREEGLQAITSAESLSGDEKARALSQGIPDLPGALVARFYQPEMKAVLAADPEDHLGLGKAFRKLISDAEYERDLQKLASEREWGKMAERVDRQIAEQHLDGEARQAALMSRAGFEHRAGAKEKSLATLHEVVAIEAESDPAKTAAELLKKGFPEATDENAAEKSSTPVSPSDSRSPAPRSFRMQRAQPVSPAE